MSTDQTGSAPSEAPATVETLAGLFEADLKQSSTPAAEPPRRRDDDEADDDGDRVVEPREEGSRTIEDDEAEDPDSADEADIAAEADPESNPATPVIDDGTIAAPAGMSEADKAAYAKLSPELKTWVSKRMHEQTADYTRKTQDVAERRKAVDAIAGQMVEKLTSLDTYLARLTDPDIRPPDPALRHQDPEAYEEQQARYVHAKDLKERAGKERERIAAERGRLIEEQQQRFWQEEAVALRELAPELVEQTPAAAQKRLAVHKYAVEAGYTPEMIKMASARDIVTLQKAMKYDAQVAAKKAVKIVAPQAPKVAKPGHAANVGRPPEATRAIQNLRDNPSVETLQDAFLAELKMERRR